MAGKRTLVCGVGVNDADYIVKGRKTGFSCPYYQRWSKMLTRCYSEKFISENESYRGCSVCDEWLLFSAFRIWMEEQSWKGKELDKDIIAPGNKIYSPETCCFVDQPLNLLLCDARAIRGPLPVGVCYHKQNNNYIAYINYKGKRVNLGSHKTIEGASKAYVDRKVRIIKEVIRELGDNRIAGGLQKHIDRLLN